MKYSPRLSFRIRQRLSRLQPMLAMALMLSTPGQVVWGDSPDATPESIASEAEASEEGDFGSGLAALQTLDTAPAELASEYLADESEDDAKEFADELAGLAEGEIPEVLSHRPMGKLKETDLQPAKFNGVQPGISTREELLANWGDPMEVHDTDLGELFIYDTSPFKRIEVLVIGDVVDVVTVDLARQIAPERLATQLHLDTFASAKVRDAQGKVLAEVFPERGVLLMFDQSNNNSSGQLEGARVGQLVVQPLDPTAFTLRVESRLHGPYESNLRDLERALQLNPELAEAYWLRAEICIATGQGVLAEESAARAVEIDPENSAYRVTWSRALEEIGKLDDAVLQVRKVIDHEDTLPIIQAKANHQLGRLSAYGDAEIMGKGLMFHNRAIALADTLVNDRDARTRRQARETLIRSHLEVARTLTRQGYSNEQKLKSLSQWIGRGSGLVEDYIESDDGSVLFRMEVAEAALDGMAEMKPARDPGPWVDEANGAADKLIEKWDDVLWQRRVRWMLGCCQYHALRIEHTRANSDEALRHGGAAIESLADAAKSRVAVPSAQAIVGSLYFHVGAVHAVHRERHDKACNWYEKAVPLLLAERPDSELAVPRREGECLVSMGVSYWSEDRRTAALDFTMAGTELVESAVIGGVLPPESLLVPYGNLASMHEDLGNSKESQRYEQLGRDVKSGRKFASQRKANGGQQVEEAKGPSKSLLDALTEHKGPASPQNASNRTGRDGVRSANPQGNGPSPRVSRSQDSSPNNGSGGYRSRPRW